MYKMRTTGINAILLTVRSHTMLAILCDAGYTNLLGWPAYPDSCHHVCVPCAAPDDDSAALCCQSQPAGHPETADEWCTVRIQGMHSGRQAGQIAWFWIQFVSFKKTWQFKIKIYVEVFLKNRRPNTQLPLTQNEQAFVKEKPDWLEMICW